MTKEDIDEKFAREVRDVFNIEAREHCENLEKMLLDFEKNLGDYSIVDHIFRVVHSLKGSALAADLRNIAELTHEMETTLHYFKESMIEIDHEKVNLLLNSNDLILKTVRKGKGKGDSKNFNILISSLKSINSEVSEEQKDDLEAAEELSPIEWLNDVDSNPKQGKKKSIKKPTTDVNDPKNNNELQTNDSSIAKTVRIRVEILDQLMRLASELVLVRNQQLKILDRTNDKVRTSTQRLDSITTDIQSKIMATRLQPIGTIFIKYKRMVRDLSLQLDKQISLTTEGNEVELDKTILESLADPLMHIIRNCCDHGIESPKTRLAENKEATGQIVIHAFHEGGLVNIEIKDDGKGIAVEEIIEKASKKGIKNSEELSKMNKKDILHLVFHPGFSTLEVVSDISGRGFGMDIVRMNIQKLGGAIDIRSTEGEGTVILLRLPLTLAIIPCLVVTCRDQIFSIPQINLEEVIGLSVGDAANKIDYVGNREVFRLRGGLLPLIRLGEVLQQKKPFTEEIFFKLMKKNQASEENKQRVYTREKREMFFFVVLKAGSKRFGLVVDQIIGTEEAVISPMHSAIKNIHIYSGATVRGDGQVSLILDAFGIGEFTGIFDSIHYRNVKLSYQKQYSNDDSGEGKPLLLFSHNLNEQFSIEQKDIKRVVKIKNSEIQAVSSYDFVTLHEDPTLVVYLNDYLEITKPEKHKEAYLIIPKGSKLAVGIYATSLADIGNYHPKNYKNFDTKNGIKNSFVINGKITLHIDLTFLLKKCQKKLSTAKNLHPAS
ncbi:MAG: chemotaxis protein CheA [Oligoflexales bacterium]